MATLIPMPSVYLRPPANDVHDGLLELTRIGEVIPLLVHGRVHFCAACRMKPEYEALKMEYAAVEGRLRRDEEQEMAPWN